MANPTPKPRALRALEQAAWSHVRLELAKARIDMPVAAIGTTARFKTLRGFFASPRGKKYREACWKLHSEFWQRVLAAYQQSLKESSNAK